MDNQSLFAIPLSHTWEIGRMLRRVNRRAKAQTTNTAEDLEKATALAEGELTASGASLLGAVLLHTSGEYWGRVNAIRTQTSLVRTKHGWVAVRATRVRDRYAPITLLLHPDLLAAARAYNHRCHAFGLPAELVPVVAKLAPECHASLLMSTCPDARLAALTALS